jgi:cobalamin biosynthetic protein CobC
MLEHGGRLRQFAMRYQRPEADWLDLSTGINPNGWPVPDLPASVWQRLPENDDGLSQAAQYYYQTNGLLAVPGSQAVIQQLPYLRQQSRVGILSPAYAEHSHCWQQAGHSVQPVDAANMDLTTLDVLIVVNPNNPTGQKISKAQLSDWHQQLQRRQGWLVVDEAFIDITPEQSLLTDGSSEGLIVLRSLGKFFGLAGLRVGFVSATADLLNRIEQALGPWPIAHASRYIATLALKDKAWQQHSAAQLKYAGQRLQSLLTEHELQPDGGCDLFQWVQTDNANILHHQLAQQGVLTRLFETPVSLRFGLPGRETDWQRLQAALETL